MTKHRVGGEVTYTQIFRDFRGALVIGVVAGGLIGFKLTGSLIGALFGSLLADAFIIYYSLL